MLPVRFGLRLIAESHANVRYFSMVSFASATIGVLFSTSCLHSLDATSSSGSIQNQAKQLHLIEGQ